MEMQLDNEYFLDIFSQKKTYEIRLNDEKRQKLKLNDTLCLINRNKPNEKLLANIIELSYFNTFKEALENTPLESIMPRETNLDTILNKYMSFKGYKENEAVYGVVRIKIKNVELF